MDKKLVRRIRRTKKTRLKIKDLQIIRLCVYRSACHIYAQLIAADGASTLASASTVDKDIKKVIGFGGNIKAATVVGKKIAEIANSLGIKKIAFDRSGYLYHGRIKALAEAAREGGLEF